MTNNEDDKNGRVVKTNTVPTERVIEVSDFINERVGGQNEDSCPVCNSTNNTVSNLEFTVPVMPTEPLLGVGPHAPAYGTVCLNCGYIRFFHKIIVDQIIDGKKSKNSDTEGKK